MGCLGVSRGSSVALLGSLGALFGRPGSLSWDVWGALGALLGTCWGPAPYLSTGVFSPRPVASCGLLGGPRGSSENFVLEIPFPRTPKPGQLDPNPRNARLWKTSIWAWVSDLPAGAAKTLSGTKGQSPQGMGPPELRRFDVLIRGPQKSRRCLKNLFYPRSFFDGPRGPGNGLQTPKLAKKLGIDSSER